MGLWILLKRNLLHKKSSAISIFLLIAIVSMVLTASVNFHDNMIKKISDANDMVETGDGVVFVDSSSFSDQILKNLEKKEYIDRMRVVDSLLFDKIWIQDSEAEMNLLASVYDDEAKLYKIFNRELDGYEEKPDKLKEGEIYISSIMKSRFSCETGDILSFSVAGRTEKFVIAGFIEDPFIGYDTIPFKNAFITKKDFERLYPQNVSHIKQVHLFADETSQKAMGEFFYRINAETSLMTSAVHFISREQAQANALIVPLIICRTLYVLIFLLLVIVTMILCSQVEVSIDIEYVKLGILRSQGFSRGELRRMLMLQFCLPAVTGAIVGMMSYCLAISFMKTIDTASVGILVPGNVFWGKTITILFAMLFVLGCFIYLKAGRTARISPVRAIRGGKADVYFSNVLQKKVLGNTSVQTGLRLAFRQFTANFKQYAGICLVLGLFVFFLSTCFAFGENFNEDFYDKMFGIATTDLCIDYGSHMDKALAVEQEIAAVSPIAGSFQHEVLTLFLNENYYFAQVISDSTYIRNLVEGKLPEYDDEILLTAWLSKKLDKNIGDLVQIQGDGYSREFIICGIYDCIEYGGNTFAVTLEGVQRMNPERNLSRKYYLLEDSTKVEAIEKMLVNKYGELGIRTRRVQKQSQSTVGSVMAIIDAMILFFYCISVVITVIVIWMACNKSFVRERMDIGIYKANGISAFRLKMQFCLRYLMMASLGSILGVILYIILGDSLNTITLTAVGITGFHAPITVGILVVPAAIIHFFVLLVSFVTFGKIDRVSTRNLIIE